MSILLVAGLPPVVVPAIANVCVPAFSSAMKKDGSAGVVIRDPAIAACAAGVTTRPPTIRAPASAAAVVALTGAKLMEPFSQFAAAPLRLCSVYRPAGEEHQ
jgi:hypothetical protein